MKKIVRILFNRNMLMLYIVNFLLADTAIFVLFLLILAGFLEKYIYLILAIIIMIGRLFVLPNFYNKVSELFSLERYTPSGRLIEKATTTKDGKFIMVYSYDILSDSVNKKPKRISIIDRKNNALIESKHLF